MLLLVWAVGTSLGLEISFKNYESGSDDGYIEVIADGISCATPDATINTTYILQHNFDSTRITGAARQPLSNTSYGIIANASDVRALFCFLPSSVVLFSPVFSLQAAQNSGMFIPEFDTTGTRSITDMWNDWVNGKVNDNEIFSYKYAPSGRVNLRPAASAAANNGLYPGLSKLPGLEKSRFNYTHFDKYYKEPWTRRKALVDDGEGVNDPIGHESFPGMMPSVHPMYNINSDGSEKINDQTRYAVRTCPGAESTGKCCLGIEGEIEDKKEVNPVGFGLGSFAFSSNTKEYRLKWRQLAYHTSFSRGIPDLKFYTSQRLAEDFAKRPQGTDSSLLSKLQERLSTAKQNSGAATYDKIDGNEFKCKLPSPDSDPVFDDPQSPNQWSFWTASCLEHFYSAVVGKEEAGMLNMKIPDWDGAKTDLYDSTASDKKWGADVNCENQPGGHCGFGYYCSSSDDDNINSCPQYRWRGRSEAIRNEKDGVTNSTYPFKGDFATYPHALDGEGDDWYNAKYRMSARLIWTGGDGKAQETELPCSITAYASAPFPSPFLYTIFINLARFRRFADGVNNVAGDFTRACSKLRATKIEWLIAAMLQAYKYGTSADLNRAGNKDRGYYWESNRGVGPTPCSYNSNTCYLNSIYNRVKMWDLDQVWSVNAHEFTYDVYTGEESSQNDNTYYKRLKNLLQVPGVQAHTSGNLPPMYRDFDTKDLKFGASDGTSRTNPHAMSCYVSPYQGNVSESNKDKDFFNQYGDSKTYYIPKPSLWPYQWGLSRSIGSDVARASPAGCDHAYGPPCRFDDADAGGHYNTAMNGKSVRMAGKKQNSDGVIKCGRLKDWAKGHTRSDWDNRNKDARSTKNNPDGTEGFRHGSHTCANLGNATHFSIQHLDEEAEEWDFRATAYHKFRIRNCNIARCQDAPVSIGCHYPLNDPSGGTHTFWSASDAYTFFFNTDNRGAPEGDIDPTADWASSSPNGKIVNPNVAWVNWGAKMASPSDAGDRLSSMHTVYGEGKKDGILECERPRDDLLLHSLLKSAKICGSDDMSNVMEEVSACRKPSDYTDWLQVHGPAHGLTPPSEPSVQNPREYYGYEGDTDFYDRSFCLDDKGSCYCGYLPRTSRLVVGKEEGTISEEKPYKPDWLNNQKDSEWCVTTTKDDAFRPRVVCRKVDLLSTPFWANGANGIPLKYENIPDAFETEETKFHFVQRKGTVFSKAELEQMSNCANSDNGQICSDIPDEYKDSATVSIKKRSPDGSVEGIYVSSVREDTFCAGLSNSIIKSTLTQAFTSNTQLLKKEEGQWSYATQTEGNGTVHCVLAKNTGSGLDQTSFVDPWNSNLTMEGLVSVEHAKEDIRLYDRIKLKQCLEGSSSCPGVVFEKRMNIAVPQSICKKPQISYTCDEETPEGKRLPLVEPNTTGLVSLKAKDVQYGIGRFEHIIKFACLDRINFFLTCEENGINEQGDLWASLCSDNVNCNLPQTFKMCYSNPFDEIINDRDDSRNFSVVLPTSRFTGEELPSTKICSGLLSNTDFNDAPNGTTLNIPPIPLPLATASSWDDCRDQCQQNQQECGAFQFCCGGCYLKYPEARKYQHYSEGAAGGICYDRIDDLDPENCACNSDTNNKYIFSPPALWECHHFTEEENGQISDGSFTPEAMCNQVEGQVWQGETDYYPGCGTSTGHCYCCKKTEHSRDLAELGCFLWPQDLTQIPKNLYSYDAHLCTTNYRTASLRDYRENIALQVYWGACDSFRVKYNKEADFPRAIIQPTRGIASAGGIFPARLPIPLSRTASARYGESATTWKDDQMRELVPNQCRSRFKTGNSPMFSRRVAFDRYPGEPAAVHSYSSCPSNETFCYGKNNVYIRNMRTWNYGTLKPFVRHSTRADGCPLMCRITENCVMASFDNAAQVCSLYSGFDGVVRLSTTDTGNMVEEPFEDVQNGIDGIFLCIGPQAEEIFPPPPPPAPLRRCPSGYSFAKVPALKPTSTCVRSVCDPKTETAVHIYERKECFGDCMTYCNAPGREFVERSTENPSFWTLTDPENVGVDYSYAAELPVKEKPQFQYVFRNVEAQEISELKVIELLLPPTRVVNCSKLKDPEYDRNFDFEIMEYAWDLQDDNQNSLANGTGNFTAQSLFSDRPQFTVVKIGDQPQNLDVPIQTYDHIQIIINITAYYPKDPPSGSTNEPLEIEFVVDGTDCGCEDVNIRGKGVHSGFLNNETDMNFENETNTTMLCNETYIETLEDEGYGSAGYAKIFLCNKLENPEVCVPHTPCPEREKYLLHPGTLEHDNICAQQTFCTESEIENTAATPTSNRECEAIVECSELQYENISVTPTSNRKCEALQFCGDDEYRHKNNSCLKITSCPEWSFTAAGPTAFSDKKCTEYTIECTDSQFESRARTPSSEKECTEFTVCAPNEFSSLEASLTSDRTCQPMLECEIHQIKHGPKDFTSDVFCEPVVHFSIAWFMGIFYAVGFVGVYAWMSYGRYKYKGYSAAPTKETGL